MVASDIAVQLRGLSRSFGTVTAVHPIDLDIPRGDFLAILGPSGCGKTTLLRMMGGFVEPNAGHIEVNGADITHLGPEHRPINMVFQGYGLFPHMNARQNVGYGLRLKKLDRAIIAKRVSEAMALVRLEGYEDHMPAQLSGGQQQRVALARALVMKPQVLLLDEPLAALDLKLRQAMQEELRRIHREIGGTFVFVTHDQGEALGLANRIAVMKDGRIEQLGTPEDIYLRPQTHFVASFIGEANLLKGRRRGGVIETTCGAFEEGGPDGEIALVVRPESVRRLGHSERAEIETTGKVDEIVFLGAHVRYVLSLSSGEKLRVQDPVGKPRAAIGDMMGVGWSRSAQRIIAG
ncbi:ABC transporter ATP-binding protein [Dongia deserti]|uniref:ABC transporter ATP-binding protein n=1 Tax=Dongia deserti TaxID=2268030 RepID=UPI0013C4B154|nr:ABC transporter ATP-binding protein [Dongia deserti]